MEVNIDSHKTRILAAIIISLLMLGSFFIFGYFIFECKHLLKTYLEYAKNQDQGIFLSAILRLALFPF